MDVQPRKVKWLLEGLIPFGAITVLAGQPGLGKSLLTIRLAADFSAGMLDQSGDVLMLTAEDPIAEVVVPRLAAARAKRSAVHFGAVNADGLSIPMRFPEDIDLLGELARETGAGLVVIDPLSAHLGGRVDSWKDQSIRGALAPLAALADNQGLAVLVVAHLNKGQSMDPLQRLGGSIGLPAAARSVLLLGRNPDDSERGDDRVLAQVKSNFGREASSLAFRIIQTPLNAAFPFMEAAEIIETGASTYEASDLLKAREPVDVSEIRAEAIAFLQRILADGPRRAKEVEAAVHEASLPIDTIKRAKSAAGVHTYKERGVVNGSWMWELNPQREATKQPAA
ncbi:MAG: AAA family ATPase [Actinomycetota bacterium]|nr:AAA family ATPase [Actinomycetota bacterium]